MKRIALLLLIFLPLHLPAQEVKDSTFGLFSGDDILSVKLAFDIGRFMAEKPEDEYLDAEITIYHSETDSIFKKIGISARGNYRRRNCDFPPIMLNLEDMNTAYTDLNKLGRVKLVSHCMHDKRYDNYVLREYLAYKVHNIITDYSFRVRLLNITYYDIDSKKLHANKTGFIIEPVKMLGERFGKKELEDIQIMPGDIEDELLLKLSVFQYLIANSDWDVPMMHNVKIFGNKDAPHELIAVPYDFDFTGWVDSHYAVARTDLGLEEITDRAFFGPCRDEEDYRPVLDYFLELENNIIDTIKDFEYLKGGEKRALLWFVKDFYRLYRKDEIMNIFMEACSNK